MTQKQLEDYLWGAANILRGMIDAADFKQYISPLLFFKRISDLWDEEYQLAIDESGGDLNCAYFAENHRFQIPEGCHWEDVRKKTIDVGASLQNVYRVLLTRGMRGCYVISPIKRRRSISGRGWRYQIKKNLKTD